MMKLGGEDNLKAAKGGYNANATYKYFFSRSVPFDRTENENSEPTVPYAKYMEHSSN